METNGHLINSAATRERIVETAERLFAELGFDGASLRCITREAGVNLAAVNYHFGTKEGLIKELMHRRFIPMNRRRLELLDRYRAEAGGGPVPLEKIFTAFLRPFFQTSAPGGKPDMVFMHMLSRAFSEKPKLIKSVYRRHFRHVRDKFTEALKETCPHLAEEDIHWRFHFALSLMMASMAQRRRIEIISDGLYSADDIETMITRLIDFTCAGFRAPAHSSCNVRAEEVFA